MYYMDEKDKKIQERMREEGKVKISNFNEMVENYFKVKYGKEGRFSFLYVDYEFYDKDYKIYSYDVGGYVSRPQNRKIRDLLPFFIEPKSIEDVRRFTLKIPGIIDINNLDSEISSCLPNGVTFITDSQIKEILLNEGYVEPFFDHYFYSMMDYPSYNLYAREVSKLKAIILDEDESKELEQVYLGGGLKQTGTIDFENFPQDTPDEATCKLLDDMFSEGQLESKPVRYCRKYFNNQTFITESFDEYDYDGRKFIKVQPAVSQGNGVTLSNGDTIDKNISYWIEAKPIDESKDKILYGDGGYTK